MYCQPNQRLLLGCLRTATVLATVISDGLSSIYPVGCRRSARFFRFFFSWGVCFGGGPLAYSFFVLFFLAALIWTADDGDGPASCCCAQVVVADLISLVGLWTTACSAVVVVRAACLSSRGAQFIDCLCSPRAFFLVLFFAADAFFFDRSMSSGRYEGATGCPFGSDGFGAWRRSLAVWERSLGKPFDLCYCFRKFGDPVKLVGSKV